jgi:hypothetical protein
VVLPVPDKLSPLLLLATVVGVALVEPVWLLLPLADLVELGLLDVLVELFVEVLREWLKQVANAVWYIVVAAVGFQLGASTLPSEPPKSTYAPAARSTADKAGRQSSSRLNLPPMVTSGKSSHQIQLYR